jgi:hypothetical protein
MPTTGKKECNPPSHGNHMQHFDEALNQALANWNGAGNQPADVSFQVLVSRNPGGVKEYRVVVGDG